MKVEEALALHHRTEEVTVGRNGATWTGRVKRVVLSPALILETEQGDRVTVVLDGAEVVAPKETER